MNNLKTMSGRAAVLRELRERLSEADTVSELRGILDRVIVVALAELESSAPFEGILDAPDKPPTMM
jgi:hypothetical protein